MANWRALLAAIVLAGFASAPARAEVDISGQWSRYPRSGDKTADPRFIPPPPGNPELKEPYAAAYADLQRRQREASAKGEPLPAAGSDCSPAGMPGLMFAVYPIEILQAKDRITVIAEADSQVRRIYMGQKLPASDEVAPGYFGYSVGRWEGDTLVVDTIGIKESVLYRDFPHSERMRITERLRLVAPGILHDVLTMEDPERLAKPYVLTFAYEKMKGYRIQEYVCENNRSYVDEKGVARMRLDGEAGK
ncbi:MAG: hypothetical protein ABIO39_03800 [Caulobacteraceae bacterium]